MNPNAKKESKTQNKPVEFKCTLDGVNWTFSDKKK